MTDADTQTMEEITADDIYPYERQTADERRIF